MKRDNVAMRMEAVMKNSLKLPMNLQIHAGAAEAGLTTGDSFTAVQAREMDFATQFTEQWKAWMKIMNIIDPVEKTPGTELVSYTAQVDGEGPAQVGPGEVVGLTKVKLKRAAHRTMKVRKHRKAVPVEDVTKYGSKVAVQKTDRAFRNKLFKDTQKRFYKFLEYGRLKGTRKTWQRAISTAVYSLQNYAEKQELDHNQIVAFANLMDYEEYIGEKDITLQSVNGMKYIQDFMGIDVLWLLPDGCIARKRVIATTMDNIIMYYTNPASADIKDLGLDFTVDPELGLIGFHANGDYTRFTGETQAFEDIDLWADRLDMICIVDVTNADAEPTVVAVNVPEDMTDEEDIEDYKEAANHQPPEED